MESKKLTKGLFITYLLAMVWIILFKLQFSFEQLDHLRNVNLIPFLGSVIVNGKIVFREIFYNVIIFVPYGIFMCMLMLKSSFIKKVSPVFITSLAFEILQFIFAIGASDITDLIGNTLGGIMGIGIFHLLSIIFEEKVYKIVNIISLIVAIIAILFVGVLIFANM